MANMDPSARLKVKRDAYFLPDSNGGVYFRNNESTFRMEGGTIDQWIEKLMPVFNGKYSLAELTDGLPEPHRGRVFEIAEILYRNGFVQDVCQDRPHRLPDGIVEKYASQIELLDSFGGSGAFRFQNYRQAKTLAVGDGPFVVSLAAALLESGLPRFHVRVMDSVPTNLQRLAELEAHARQSDPEVAVEVMVKPRREWPDWREIVRPFEAVLYIPQEGKVDELRAILAACREEKKVFLPAICVRQAGLAGPLVHPEAEGCWESAWRRIHQTALDKDPELHTFSSTAGALLANVIVFEWFKLITGVTKPEQHHPIFKLDLETLEGSWQPFLPHPLVSGHRVAERVADFESRIEQHSGKSGLNDLLSYFGRLTSPVSGIFHVWEEGDLKQLPLSQCRVKVVNPLSQGPAELLPDIICSGLTHEMARKEAGLAGLEAYVSQMSGLHLASIPSLHEEIGPHETVGIGAGESMAEAVCRGLQKCLSVELCKREANGYGKASVHWVRLEAVKDEQCRFYLQALAAIQGELVIGLGEEIYGFPVVWVGLGDQWIGGTGLNTTWALRNALQQALKQVQNETADNVTEVPRVSSVRRKAGARNGLVIPACNDTLQPEVLKSALQVLERDSNRLIVVDLTTEPFMKEGIAGVFGVLVRGGDSG